MAKAHGKNLYFAMATISGGAVIDLTAYTQEVSGLPGEIELGDVTAGADSGRSYFPGLQKASFSVKFVFDTTSTGSWDVCRSFQGDTAVRAFSFGPAGTTAALPLYTGNCWIRSLDFPVSVTEPNTFTINCEVDDSLTIGVVT